MKIGSVCSGLGTAELVGMKLGCESAWVAEVEPAPCAILAHRFSATAPVNPPYWLDAKKMAAWHKTIKGIKWGTSLTNWGDMTLLPQLIREGKAEAPDVLVGGTPCQAFSVAGKRAGLDDLRGNMTLTFVEIANAIDAVRVGSGRAGAAVIWENVPGVLSDKTNAFGCLLSALCGYPDPIETISGKWPRNGSVVGPRRRVAWATLDAQYFGVPQRRRRVWLVAVPDASAGGRAGAWPDPAELLALGSCVRGLTPQGREAGQGIAGAAGAGASGAVYGQDGLAADKTVSHTCSSKWAKGSGGPAGDEAQMMMIQPVTALPIDSMNHLGRPNGDHSFSDIEEGPSYTLSKGHHHAVAILPKTDVHGVCAPLHTYEWHNQDARIKPIDTAATLNCNAGGREGRRVAAPMDVGTITAWGGNAEYCSEDGLVHPLRTAQPEVVYGAVGERDPRGISGDTYNGTISETHQSISSSASDINHTGGVIDRMGQSCNNGSHWDSPNNPHPALTQSHNTGGIGASNQELLSQRGSGIVPSFNGIRYGVRRLMPVEDERLQGLPDDHTNVPFGKKMLTDGHRYKAVGNGWAAPCFEWVLEGLMR